MIDVTEEITTVCREVGGRVRWRTMACRST